MKMQAEGVANAIATDALSKFLFLFHVFFFFCLPIF
jgi:hypothetical protein